MKFFFVCLIYLNLPSAWAGDRLFQLFHNGRPTAQYDQVVQNLRPSDKVSFSNGRVFQVTQNYTLLSGEWEHGTTAVLGIEGGRVLRIAKHASKQNIRIDQSYLAQFVAGYQDLVDAGEPTVKVFVEESFLPEYVIAEELTISEHLDKFLRDLSDDPHQMESVRRAAFSRFAQQLWAFAFIGDFAARQVGLTLRGYVLFDWTDDHFHYSEGTTDITPLEGFKGYSPEVDDLVLPLIQKIKTLRRSHPCDSLLRPTG